jgi:hypothetical protein
MLKGLKLRIHERRTWQMATISSTNNELQCSAGRLVMIVLAATKRETAGDVIVAREDFLESTQS